MGLLDEIIDWYRNNIEKPASEEDPTEGFNPQVNKPSVIKRVADFVNEEGGSEATSDNDPIGTLGRQSLSLEPENSTPAVVAATHEGSYPTAYVPEPGRRAYEPPPGEEIPKDGESIDEYIARTTQEEKGARQEVTTGSIADIAKKYGGEVSPSGGIISEKEIPGSEGLIDKGYVEKDGKKIHIYGKKPEKESVARKEGPADNESKITAFENSVIKQMGYDPRTLNPEAEAQKIVNQNKKALFSHIFGNIRPGDMSPEMRRHWGTELNKYYNKKLNEFKTKKANDEGMLKTLVGRFEKEHLEKYATAPEGTIIWDKKTGQRVTQLGDKGKANVLQSHVITEIDKAVDKRFLDDADESKMAMGGKIYESLPKEKRAEHDAISELAKKIMQKAIDDKKSLTPDEAVRLAMDNVNKEKTVSAGTKLNKETAVAILKEAKGDKNKARQIAKERGYSL